MLSETDIKMLTYDDNGSEDHLCMEECLKIRLFQMLILPIRILLRLSYSHK